MSIEEYQAKINLLKIEFEKSLKFKIGNVVTVKGMSCPIPYTIKDWNIDNDKVYYFLFSKSIHYLNRYMEADKIEFYNDAS